MDTSIKHTSSAQRFRLWLLMSLLCFVAVVLYVGKSFIIQKPALTRYPPVAICGAQQP